jgi:hypothetical protein
MNAAPKFLVKANAEEERMLYTSTLLRKFPTARVLECDRTTRALTAATDGPLDGAIVHFNGTPEAIELVQALRRTHPALPIIATSGVDRATKALAAGATRFVLAAEWLTLGSLMQEMLSPPRE